MALHVFWDFPQGVRVPTRSSNSPENTVSAPGSINPNLFQDQEYKYGSFGNPDAEIRNALCSIRTTALRSQNG